MTPINKSELSPRAGNVLTANGINTMEELELSSQLQLRSMIGSGPKTVREITRYFAEKTGTNLRVVPLKRKGPGRSKVTYTNAPKFMTFVEDAPVSTPVHAEPIFMVGDVVKLRSGGASMTVLNVYNNSDVTYDLMYFADGIRVAERITEVVLTSVE
jgi:hypothetical protein